MQKNIEKKLILLLITTAFVLTIMGATNAATHNTDLSLTINQSSVDVGNPVTFTSRLTRQGTSNGVNSQTIHFFVDGTEVGSATTQGTGVNSGRATTTYTPLTGGIKNVQAQFFGTADPPGSADGYNPSNSTNRTLTVNYNRAPTTLTVNPASGYNGDTVPITATLTKTSDSTHISGRTVSFTVNGVNAGSSTTNVNGVATINYLINNMNAAGYPIVATFTQDNQYSGSTGSNTLTVNRIPTSLSVNSPGGYNGDTVGITATLVRQGTATGIGNKPVTFTVNGVSNTVTTDVNGVATWNYLISNLPAGPYDILVNFAQDDYYAASSNLGTLTVNRIPTSLSVNSPGGYNGDTVGITATLVRQGTATGIGNKPVTFTVNGVSNTVTTDVNGVATWNYLISNLPAGQYDIWVNFAQDDYYAASSNLGTLTVNRIPTSLSVNSPGGYNGDTVGITATLVRQGTATGIGNKPVTFTVNGVSNTVTTDVNGVATWNYLISNLPAGQYDIWVNFAQDDYYAASSNLGTLTVNGVPTSLKVADVKGNKGETVNLIATLTDPTHGNAGIVGKTVLFTVNGVNAGSATTNTSGVAILPYQINLNGGNYPITAEFIPDNIYQGSKDESTLKVPTAALEITKTVNNNTPRVNDTVIYTLIVQNHGPDAATQVIVNEVIPTNGLKFVGVDSVTYGTDANGVWTIGGSSSQQHSQFSVKVHS